jgi:hypothetical protein
VIWVFGILGILLALLGLWGGPSSAKRREAEAAARKSPTVAEAWEILAKPLEDEVIKIPAHRPWRVLGGDRRFFRGLFVGLGAGLLVAAMALSSLPDVQPPSVASSEPSGQKDTAAGTPAPATGTATAPAQSKPPAAAEPAAKPGNVTFVVEDGDAASTIAANLKKEGLIADENAFLNRLTELGADTMLKAGTFVVPTGASIDDVIKVLTA